MSSEDEYQPPDPNLVSIKKKFRASFPRNAASQNKTCEDQTYTLWGKEFKFGFELTGSRTLDLINKSSRAVWINDRNIYYRPVRVMPSERLSLSSFRWKSEFTNEEIRIKGSFLIVLGIQFDPEPSLQQNLLALLHEKNFTDFKLKCGKEEFPCHKAILAARSSVLAEAFAFSSEESQHEYELKGFDPAVLKTLLDVLYTGRVAGDVDDRLETLADYLNIKLVQEQVPDLKPFSVHGDLYTLKDWDQFTFSLRHEVQIEPSFAAKNVEFTWTISNYTAWREAQPANHIEQLPEKRITFLDKEYSFECHLRLDQNNEAAFLVSRCEGLAFIKGDAYTGPLFVLQPNSFIEGRWHSCKRWNQDLVVNFEITILMMLDFANESQLQQDLLGLHKDCLDPDKGNKFTDFKLCCGKEEFPCHKGILAARSPTFAQIFKEDPKGHQLIMEDFSPAHVRQMLEFIYTETLNGEAGQGLLKLANKFQIKGFKKACGRSLAKTVTLANALDLLDEANSHSDGALKNLLDSVLDFCADNYWQLRNSDEWKKRVQPHSPSSQISDFSIFTREKPVCYE